jgi:hypothetical protein
MLLWWQTLAFNGKYLLRGELSYNISMGVKSGTEAYGGNKWHTMDRQHYSDVLEAWAQGDWYYVYTQEMNGEVKEYIPQSYSRKISIIMPSTFEDKYLVIV